MAAQESIYNLVPEEQAPVVKPPMYRSMHDPKGPIVGSTFGERNNDDRRPPATEFHWLFVCLLC